jgi:hypothetical protein
MSLHKNCGWWKNSDCIFEFSVKSYVTNTINLSCPKILLPSVIEPRTVQHMVTVTTLTELSQLQTVRRLSRSIDLKQRTCRNPHGAMCHRMLEYNSVTSSKTSNAVRIESDHNITAPVCTNSLPTPWNTIRKVNFNLRPVPMNPILLLKLPFHFAKCCPQRKCNKCNIICKH